MVSEGGLFVCFICFMVCEGEGKGRLLLEGGGREVVHDDQN